MSFIRRFLRSFFYTPEQKTAAAAVSVGGLVIPQETPLYDGNPIPAYPDKGCAAPAATPQMLYDSQIELINRLQQSSSYSHEDFNNLLKPVILNYAAYVHLLPASETNHHCGQGGLFRHGLEVALNAANACVGKVFAWDAWASEREQLIPRWRMCAIIGGMLHDMGKPIVDVGAVDETGNLKWNPHTGSLYSWLTENELSHYYIHWRPGARHKRHEAFNPITIYRIVPDATMRWLTQFGGQEPMDYMVMSLNGSADPRNPIAAIIKKADSDSVNRDIRDSRQRLSASGQGGARNLAARIIRTMYDQIEGGPWHINKPSSPIYFTTEGIFGLYPAVITESINILRHAGETSLPNDSAAILDLLNDWGFISEHRYPSGLTTNTMNVRIHLNDNGKQMITSMHVIRFAREEIIPQTVLPVAPIHAEILGQDGKPIQSGTFRPPPSETDQAPSKSKGDTMPSKPATDNSKSTKVPGIPTPVANDDLHLYQASTTTLMPASDEDEIVPEEATMFDAPPSEPHPEPEQDDVLRDRSLELDPRVEAINEAYDHVNKGFPPTNYEDALLWLAQPKQTPEGEFLLQIARRIHRGELIDEVHVFDRDQFIYLKSLDAFMGLGVEPIDLRGMFEKKNWTETDSSSSKRTTVSIDVGGKKIPCTRLNHDISTIFRLISPSKDPNKQTAMPESKNKPKAIPLGPYIGREDAELFTSFDKSTPQDAQLIRPIFFQYLQDISRTDGYPYEAIDVEKLEDAIQTFIQQHRLKKTWLMTHLSNEPNNIISLVPNSNVSRRFSKYQLNQDYDVTKDRIAANNQPRHEEQGSEHG